MISIRVQQPIIGWLPIADSHLFKVDRRVYRHKQVRQIALSIAQVGVTYVSLSTPRTTLAPPAVAPRPPGCSV